MKFVQLVLLAAIVYPCLGCATSDPVALPIAEAADLTTTTQDLPGEELLDAAEFRSRTRVAVLEGLAVADAVEHATSAGWQEVVIFDLDEPIDKSQVSGTNGIPEVRITLTVESGIVLEAWAG